LTVHSTSRVAPIAQLHAYAGRLRGLFRRDLVDQQPVGFLGGDGRLADTQDADGLIGAWQLRMARCPVARAQR
jgi:hypothetical protein